MSPVPRGRGAAGRLPAVLEPGVWPPPRRVLGSRPLGWALAAALAAGLAQAEVYRYLDEAGRWQFTDRPRPGDIAPLGETPADPGTTSGTPSRDLESRLRARFQPTTPVQESSLAVVKIETEVGNGSGFFVSERGLILTNRHVVRPPRDWVQDREKRLAEMKAGLDRLEAQLKRPRSAYRNPEDYDEGKRILRVRAREYRIAKRELDMKRYAAELQSSFRIELKDGTRLSARLLDLSTSHDLALLELEGYRTPVIRPLTVRRLEQGEPVYAIGSPLGIADTITKGIFTSRREGLLVTDARILPGNSGGPLVTEEGQAAGVNVIKLTQSGEPATERGFGLAIPIDLAYGTFEQLRAR